MRRLVVVYIIIITFLSSARGAFLAAFDDDEHNAVLTADIIADRSHTFSTALLPTNVGRNRYPSVLANEATRVHLSSGAYINANHFRVKDVPISYIMTQAPLPNTVAEFWAMVWEQRAKVIVQLNAEDGGYLENITSLENITHYHFTSWPDLGVPDTTRDVLELVRMVGDTSPMVVHCKGGVGRTGTFIAIHAAVQMAKLGLSPHVASIVRALKETRTTSVETREQYVFAHSAVDDL